MDTVSYFNKFHNSANQLDKIPFDEVGLQFKVGVWCNSVVLKIQKPIWTNNPSLLTFDTSVFFSVWISDEAIREGKLYYNIHALKLRGLKRYKLKSRDFAGAFRSQFKPFEKDWPNVCINFGPLTLMEGWVKIDLVSFDNELQRLAYQFLAIRHIIDNLFEQNKK